MKKLLALGLISILAVFVMVCGDNQNGTQAQEQVGPLPNYGFEADHMSIAEIGRVFEQMGREMQQNGTATFLGVTYPMGEAAHIEFGVRRRAMGDRGVRTSFGAEFGTSDEADLAARPEGRASTYYEGPLADGTPAEVADVLDQFADDLENSGAFSWDFHSGPFSGTAIVDQYLGVSTRRERQFYRLMTDITFGEGEVQRHDDREDLEEMVEAGTGEWLGQTTVEGVDRATVAEAIRGMAENLRSGQITVGDGQAPLEIDQVRVNWAHVFIPGGSEKVEMMLQWSNDPPPEPMGPPEGGPARYYEEPTNMPVAELAALLQRIATEILEDGTFVVDGQEYTVGETVGGEIGFRAGGMTIDVGWNR